MKRFIQSLMFALAVMLGLNVSAQLDTVVVGNGTTSGYNAPYNNYYHYSWNESRYAASAINHVGVIQGIAYDVATAASLTCSEVNIYMGIASSDVISSTTNWTPMSDLTLVYSAQNVTIGANTGWEPVVLQTPFVYDGSGALVVVVSHKSEDYTNTLKYNYTTNSNRMMYRQNDSQESYASHPGTATGTRSGNLANIAIVMSDMPEGFCYAPTSLTTSNVGAYQVDLDWTPRNESSWVVYLNGDSVATTSTHPYTFTGLNQHTNYTLGVKALCGEDNESAISTTSVLTAYACPVPTNLAATASTPNSITIGWTAGGEENAWRVACNGDTMNVTTNPYTITGLDHSTSYRITLWADCGDVDGVSLQSTSINATTECSMITEFPWSMDFDAVAGSSGTTIPNVPVCWDEYTETTNSSYVAYPIVYSSSTYAHSGSNSLRYYIGTAATFSDQIAVLPEMQNVGGKMISFWARVYTSSHINDSKVAIGVCEDFENQVYTWLDTVSVTSTDYAFFEVYLSNYQGTGNRIAIRGIKPASNYCAPYIDDITVEEIPTCFHPTNLTLTDATENSLTISWTAGASETQWQVTCGEDTYTANTTSYTITGLSANTGYEVSVVAVCSADDMSTAIGASYRTACGTTQGLPYSEDFNSYAGTQYNQNGPAPACWTVYSNGTTAAYTPHVCNSGSYWYSPDGSGSLAFTSGSATYGDTALAILPVFETPVSELQLSFTYKMENASYGEAHVGYMVDGEFVSSTTLTGTTDYTTGTFTFANAPANATNLAILWYHNSSYYSFGVDDLTVVVNQGGGEDTTVTEPTCDWNGNVDGQSYAFYWKQDHNNGIYDWAEKFSNNSPVMIDTVSFLPYIVNGTGSFSMAIYDATAAGTPGNQLYSQTLSYTGITPMSYNDIVLTQPVIVTGDYFVAFHLNDTPATDTLALLSTDVRTDNVSTAYTNYNGNWYKIGQLFTNNGTPLHCSFFILAQTCPVSSTETYTVTVTANDATMGTVTGGGEYDAFETVTLTATANSGYYFSMWSDSVTANPRTITVTSDITLTAIFAPLPDCGGALPYICGFESATDMLCWTAIDGDNDGHNWYLTQGAQSAHAGSYCMQSESYNQSAGGLTPSNWLISPELTIPAEGATLTWFARGYNSSYFAENYKVVLSATGSTDTLSFSTTLYDGTTASNTWTEMTAQITTPGTVRIAFVHYNTEDVWSLLLDDISVVSNGPVAPTCDTVTNIHVENVTYNSADLYWSTTADSCHLEVLVDNEWVSMDNWGIAIESSYFFWGLEPETTYQVRVRAICGENVYSDWNTFSFTTDEYTAPDCIDPTIDSIVAGSRSAAVYWNHPSAEDFGMCELQYVVSGDQFNDTLMPDYVWFNPHTILGLNPETTYQVRIRAYCYYDEMNEEEVYSNWVYSTFTTAAADPNEGTIIPHTGSETLIGDDACGLDITVITDDEGLYLGNANGTLILTPAEGDTLTLTGTYDIEEGWDFLVVTANGATDSLTGEGTVNITTTGTIVLNFVTDGSTWGDYDGVDLHTSCTSGSEPQVECDPIALPYTTSFEADDESVDCWGSIDADGDEWEWYQMGIDEDGWEEDARTGEAFMMSFCYDLWESEELEGVEDWLLTPEFIVPEGGATVSFWASSYYEGYGFDKFQLKLAPNGGNSVEDFTVTVMEDSTAYSGWSQYTATFTQAGTVRLALVHTGCTDQYYRSLMVDDFSIEANGTTQPEMFNIQVLAAVYYPAQGDTLFLIEEEADMVGSGEYAEGTEVSISVTPLGEFANVTFLGWQDGNTDMPRTITVSEDATYTAYFQGQREGIDGVEMSAISLYPNPATEQVTVTGYQGTIYVLDMTGRVVLSSETNTLDIRNLASGAYFVKAGAQVKKLVVK